MNIKGRGSRRKEKAPELLEFKDLQTSFYYFRGAGGNAAKKATVNYLTKVVTPSAVAEDKADFDMPVLTANKKYASIIIPQDGVQKITITIGGKDFIYDNGTPFKLESGKITTVNLEVGRDEIKLGEVKITNWENGSTFSGEALN